MSIGKSGNRVCRPARPNAHCRVSRGAARHAAYFVSPHGFGHAARAASVMSAVQDLAPEVFFHIFTTVPRWFFEDSLKAPFAYHRLLTDIGLVQKTPLEADLAETVRRLKRFFPLDPSRTLRLAERVRKTRCELVLCDIAPLGIAVARTVGIASVLVENFTWDWIYGQYADADTRVAPLIDYLKDLFRAADYLVQTEPVCRPRQAHCTTAPVSRAVTGSPEQVRKRLGIPEGEKMAVITMGGSKNGNAFSEPPVRRSGIFFVVPGVTDKIKRLDNVILLPRRSRLFHPNLIHASDVVVGKAGYSTLAEVYHAGVPFGYVTRDNFRESAVLARYIEENMHCVGISETQFKKGQWLSVLPQLLAAPRIERKGPNGALQAARFVTGLL